MSEDLTKKLSQSENDKLSLILATVQSLETRTQHLEEQMDKKRYDTRPIWEKVGADIAQLQETLNSETREIRHKLGDLIRGQSVLNDAILKIHIDFRDIDERIRRLEVNRNLPNSST